MPLSNNPRDYIKDFIGEENQEGQSERFARDLAAASNIAELRALQQRCRDEMWEHGDRRESENALARNVGTRLREMSDMIDSRIAGIEQAEAEAQASLQALAEEFDAKQIERIGILSGLESAIPDLLAHPDQITQDVYNEVYNQIQEIQSLAHSEQFSERAQRIIDQFKDQIETRFDEIFAPENSAAEDAEQAEQAAATESANAVGDRIAEGGVVPHVVERGDSLGSIARGFAKMDGVDFDFGWNADVEYRISGEARKTTLAQANELNVGWTVSVEGGKLIVSDGSVEVAESDPTPEQIRQAELVQELVVAVRELNEALQNGSFLDLEDALKNLDKILGEIESVENIPVNQEMIDQARERYNSFREKVAPLLEQNTRLQTISRNLGLIFRSNITPLGDAVNNPIAANMIGEIFRGADQALQNVLRARPFNPNIDLSSINATQLKVLSQVNRIIGDRLNLRASAGMERLVSDPTTRRLVGRGLSALINQTRNIPELSGANNLATNLLRKIESQS